ncbi:MAG: autotransporter-associated beta strand repeat-containing protein [Prosthecobacter sp.]|uniref:autotransporter-associated beta strand repeat-containing protein n=1 Tax=Prosthecobacter sp. TaxID=1965333 RepID=UPI00390217C1
MHARSTIKTLILSVGMAVLLAIPDAQAGTVLWTGGTDFNWDTSTANWSNGGTNLYTDGDIVQFGDTGGGNLSISVLAAGVSPLSLNFTDTGAGTNAYAFTNASGVVGITGATGLTLDAGFGGSVTLASTNTYTGATTIKSGTLVAGTSNGVAGISSASAVFLGDTSGSANATLQVGYISSTNYSNNITVQTGNSGVATINGHGNLNLNGTLTLGSASSVGKSVTLAEIGNSGWLLNMNGVIQDAAGMTPGTAGTVTIGSSNIGTVYFSAANTFTGDTVMGGNTGTLRLNHANALQNSTLDTGASGDQQVIFSAASTFNLGGLKGADDLAIGSNSISVGANHSSNTYLGIISGAGGAFTKVGNGTQTLSSDNTYDGATTISGGTLQIGSGGTTGSISNASAVTNNGTLAFNRSDALTVSSVISGTGAVQHLGAGTTTLTGANTYSGTTTISAGTLQVGNGGSTGSLGSGAIVNNASLVYTLDSTATASLPAAGITGSGNLSATAGYITLNGNITQGGTLSLAQGASTGLYSGIGLGAVSTTLTAASITMSGDVGKANGDGNSLALDTSAANGAINLNISLGRSGAWYIPASFSANAGTGAINITGSGPASSGWRDTPVTLTGALNITGNVNSDALVTADSNGTTSGTVSGALSGAMPLAKTGSGTLTLTGANTYTGSTTISGGTLQVGNGGTTGSISNTSAVTNNGTLAFNRSDALTLSSVISGTGAVQQLGAGITALTGANTYTGSTAISAGTLQVGNGGATGSISNTSAVTNNGTLAFNRSGAFALSSVISGTGAVQQLGAGTTTLTGASTYTGGTTISGGIMEVNNTTGSATGSGNVVVNASLAGDGFIVAGGANTVQVNGTVLVGRLAATQATDLSITASSIALGSSSTCVFDVWPTGGIDVLRLNGSVSIANGAKLRLANPTGRGFIVGESLQVLDLSGATSVTGSFSSIDTSAFNLGGLQLDTSNLLTTGVVTVVAPTFAPPEPVISEFMAKNDTGITDEDGQRGDWIEIHNPSATARNMAGWYLTDLITNKTKWMFPAVTIEPGGFLLVWADSKNRRVVGSPLHTNFALSNNGEYLGLIRPDGTTVQHEFAPTFPPQVGDRSYGLVFARSQLLAAGANADYLAPATASALASDWKTVTTTPGTWTMNQPTGLGFGLTVPGMTITVRGKNGALDSLAAGVALLARPSGHSDIANESISILPVFNVLGEGGDGHYSANQLLPAWALNDYVYQAKGIITIPTAGVWTFGLNSDDGGRILIDGNIVMDDPAFHGAVDHLGSVTLAAGNHTFEAFYFEAGGGDEGEFYAAPGNLSAWDATMKLVGDTANGGLASVTTPLGVATGASSAVQTNIETAMRNVNASAFIKQRFIASAGAFTTLSLQMRYNDGFTAWVNGTSIAASNAPATLAWDSAATGTRTNAQTLAPLALNVSAVIPSLLSGTNQLAIQGLNTSAADDSFLMLPELIAGSLPATPVVAFFNNATPNTINALPSSLGKVATLAVSPKRGVYPDAVVTSVPFNVTLSTTTPSVSIRYTTDGTLPTETNGANYTAPISITLTTTLRAAAFKPGWETSKVSTHSYILPADVITQSPTGAPPAAHWPTPDASGNVNGQAIDYGMDPDIVNSTDETIGGAAQVQSALRAIPSVSIVMPNTDLFSPSTGIYVNALGRGLAWERPCSIEWLNDPTGGFQEDCGIRTRGGYSRVGANPKHSFHFYFRSEYGNGTLNFPLFGLAGTNSFNQFDIRTSQNYAWSFYGDPNNTFLRDEFSRQTQLEMGSPGSRVRYCQVYLNGQYWGLYDLDERTEADFCTSYIGGSKANWDVVKSEVTSGFNTGATDGDLTAWQLLFNKANPLIAAGTYTRRTLTTAEYHDLMGLAADGVTPNTSPVLLDADNLIDYMLNTFWTGNLDGCTSAFLGENNANNWFGARDRTANRGFIFFVHDAEHTLFNPSEDRTGPFKPTITDLASFNAKQAAYNPMFLHADLMDVPEYRKRWHNRVQHHLFNGGALSASACTDRINRIAPIVESTIIAESARWGDAKVAVPMNRNNWRAARDYILQTYIPQRSANVITQLRADGLYPTTAGVSVTPSGGYITSTSQLNLTAAATVGTMYYTINGSDPQNADGTLNTSAVIFAPNGEVRTTLIADGSASGSAGAGATWKYRDPSIDLGSSDIVHGHASYSSTNWKHPSFDDTNSTIWKDGDAELGAGDSPRTTINIGPSGERSQVIYFRKKFTVTNPGQYNALELDLKRDDGAIIYINGKEVGRSNMPSGPIGYAYNGLGVSDADEETFYPVTDPRLLPNVLVEGENTIAVQVHQVNATSSDISFDLRLKAVRTLVGSPITLAAGVQTIRARTFDGTNWSALSEAIYVVGAVPANASNLAITELHYHPGANPATSAAEATAGFLDESNFEFIELTNISAQPIDLMGISLTSGVSWIFDSSATAPRLLAPGQRVVIVDNPIAFAIRYGSSIPIAGNYSGSLDNGGEYLALHDSSLTLIHDLTYDDIAPWPLAPDGTGPSLVLINPSTNPNPALAANWRASYSSKGSPGTEDVFNLAAYLANIGQTDPNADPDDDGMSHFFVYATGHNLRRFTQNAKLVNVTGTDYPTLEYTRRKDTPDVTYTVQASIDLVTWTQPTAPVDIVNNNDGTETIRVRTTTTLATQPRQFLRLQLTQAP